MDNLSNEVKVLIVDDERDSREVLEHHLLPYPTIRVVGHAANIDQAQVMIELMRPDLVMLDIQMPRGDAFALLRRYEKVDFAVIFVTSYDRYAIDAIRHNALDYILKPVSASEMREVLDRALHSIDEGRRMNQQLKALVEGSGMENPRKKVPVHVNGHVRMVNVDDILYIEADGRYSIMKMADGTSHTLVRMLKEVEGELAAVTGFIRISKSQLLNVRSVRQYSKGHSCMITMDDYRSFEVSRRKKTAVLMELAKWESAQKDSRNA